MKKKLSLKLIGSICLILLLLIPAKAQTQTPSKIYRIEVRTATFGGSTYILGFAISDILNKKSTWVRGSVLESTGTTSCIKTVGGDPEKRKRTIINCAADTFFKAKNGEPPFEKNAELYKDVMIMMFQQYLGTMFVTIDPNIKTLADLKGKRVATWPRGTTKFEHGYNLIAGAGKEVLDSIQWQYTAYAGYEDLIVKKVDAALGYCSAMGPGQYSPLPQLKELMTKRRIYFITATPEMRLNSRKLFGDAYGATVKLKANIFGTGIPRQDILCFNAVLAWGIYPNVPEDVVYEIMKTLNENHAMFKEYHSSGKNVLPETYGLYPAPKEYWHPGARKYYDEKGIGYGTDYFFNVFKTD